MPWKLANSNIVPEYVNTVGPTARDPLKTRRSDRSSHLAGPIVPHTFGYYVHYYNLEHFILY